MESIDLQSNEEKAKEANDVWNEHEIEMEERRKDFLEWIKNTFHPKKLLYAGSGRDIVPKNIFGKDNVLHLSLEENETLYSGGYFSELGSGKKIKGDFLQAPFKEKSMDAVYIHNTPNDSTTAGIEEFCRVLKDSGVLILDNGEWTTADVEKFIAATERDFEKIKLPENFDDPNMGYKRVVILNKKDPEFGMGSSLGMVRMRKTAEKLLKNAPEGRGRIYEQSFWVFKKKLDNGT